MTIRLAIFNLSGTIVDKYGLFPFLSIKNAFKVKGINIPNDLIYKDININKYDHINKILNNEYISRKWMQKHGEYPKIDSSMSIYDEFIHYQMNEGIKNIEILPETRNAIKWLGNNNISTGVTTDYNRPIMNIIKEKLLYDDIHIDKYVSSTCLGKPGRPNPYMILDIMNKLDLAFDSKRVIKIDDTVSGINEGKNAGILTIGVAKWSINMKMNNYDQRKNMNKEEYIERLKNSREILWSANPDYVIDDLNELPQIINHINSEY